MPKAKGKNRRKKFNYEADRKKIRRRMNKKAAPRIECDQIRRAWDQNKSAAQNLAQMGLAMDPNKTLPIKKGKIQGMASAREETIILKPYVINELEAEANLPEEKKTSLSRDLIDYVEHMITNYKDNYKAMARDEKNYYQDTPNQIRKKIEAYKRIHPDEHAAFLKSLAKDEMETS
ncbi:nucleolar protein 16 [Callorhinchus milii]|uniref:Nucleolar protein 16 n=1 Tax=Callorhinchus milii TaxID=7868 RepID=V9L5V3_CALMI|nr:nucleolar protein 16 [Callorhinchus milii]|eukprot:gi/632975800/ref/XP_007904430.1/ PREDICTED: nucleolar protein 16 [Callorhinchus milii]